MRLDERLLQQARESGIRWTDAQHEADLAKADYYHAIRRLHLAGASLREIADALDLSHQRVHQIIEASGGTAGWKVRKKSRDQACAFCGRPQADVTQLVAGPGVFICEKCVAAARRVVRESGPVAHLDTAPLDSGFSCAFCRKPAKKLESLVAGPGVCICGKCVEFCDEILATQSN